MFVLIILIGTMHQPYMTFICTPHGGLAVPTPITRRGEVAESLGGVLSSPVTLVHSGGVGGLGDHFVEVVEVLGPLVEM